MVYSKTYRGIKTPYAVSALALAALLATSGCSDDLPFEGTLEVGDADPAVVVGHPEGTDVWLLELVDDNGALRAESPRNLTNRPGYDNQPFFTPGGKLMFVQMENEKTDIWQWDAQTQQLSRVTETPEQGEFSPTPIPDSDGGISYIRSPDDTSGRLWRMPEAGAAPEVIFPDLGPVGYHAWFDSGHVALWRLQEPSMLQLVELQSKETLTLATGVGRSPQSVPNRRAVSFTRMTDGGRVVEAYDLDTRSTELIVVLPEGGDFHTWTPDGVLLATVGAQVVAWRESNWETVVDLSALGLTLSRLNVSSDGKRLAVVAEPE